MKELAIQLFKALDDTIRKEYHIYSLGEGDYPSGAAIEALSVAQGVLHVESLALGKMGGNLARDILGETQKIEK